MDELWNMDELWSERWDLSLFTETKFMFGLGDKELIIDQLRAGTRLILSSGVRGYATVEFYGKYLCDGGKYYIWITNDERRRLLRKLLL